MLTLPCSSRQQIISRFSFFVVKISLKQDSRRFITLWQVWFLFDELELTQTLMMEADLDETYWLQILRIGLPGPKNRDL